MKHDTSNRKSRQESSQDLPYTVVPLGISELSGVANSLSSNFSPVVLLPKINCKGCYESKESEEGKERLLTLPKAAKYLGRTVWSMRHLAGKGSLPYVREGKRIFFDVNDLDKYVERNKMSEVEPPVFKKVSSQARQKEGR